MPRYHITVSFDTDRLLTEDEFADLLSAISVQVEEPEVRNTDETLLDPFVDATYTTSNIALNHDFPF